MAGPVNDHINKLLPPTDSECRDLLYDLFETDNQSSHKSAVKSLVEDSRESLLIDVATSSFPPPMPAWLGLVEVSDVEIRSISDGKRQQLMDFALRLLRTESVPLQVANTRVICRHFRDLKPQLIQNLSPLALRTFCVLADDEDFVPLIAKLLESDEPIPAAVGQALSPTRLIQLPGQDASTADILAARHGYTVRVPLPEARPYLQVGVYHVNSAVLSQSPTTIRGDVDAVLQDILDACQAIGSRSTERTVEPRLRFRTGLYAQAVLFAAVRELDHANQRMRRKQSPFDFTLMRDIAAGADRFMQLPESLLRQSLIGDARQAAFQNAVPDNLINSFIIEYAACRSMPTDDQRHEYASLLHARWQQFDSLSATFS